MTYTKSYAYAEWLQHDLPWLTVEEIWAMLNTPRRSGKNDDLRVRAQRIV